MTSKIEDEWIVRSIFNSSRFPGMSIDINRSYKWKGYVGKDRAGNHYYYASKKINGSQLEKIMLERKVARLRSFILITRNAGFEGKRVSSVVKKNVKKEFILELQGSLSRLGNHSPTSIEIEEANMSELRNVELDELNWPYHAEEDYLSSNLKHNNLTLYLAKRENLPVGILLVRLGKNCEILWLATRAGYQRCGIGRALIAAFLCNCGSVKLRARIPEDAYFFFTKCGFVERDVLRYYSVIDAHVFEGRNQPFEFPFNSVLKTKAEYQRILKKLKLLNLPWHIDGPKNWDSAAALSIIMKMFPAGRSKIKILDAGGEVYSSILPLLECFGFKNMEAINLEFKSLQIEGSVTYRMGDITGTSYENKSFDAITCLSVVEHGVDLGAYFAEMSRILKPRGVLITSTDYWDKPIDTRGKVAYGVPVKIFNYDDLQNAIALAAEAGLVLLQKFTPTVKDPVVNWLGVNYTFAYFTLIKRV